MSHERWKTADEIANGSQHAAPNKFVAVEERREKRARLLFLALICVVMAIAGGAFIHYGMRP